ncbi:MAG: hypothetical protein OXU79_11855 [Gemmatimonadota bacterium]|nr:hypothetical protein [Gemmatimonadota bacterium]
MRALILSAVVVVVCLGGVVEAADLAVSTRGAMNALSNSSISPPNLKWSREKVFGHVVHRAVTSDGECVLELYGEPMVEEASVMFLLTTNEGKSLRNVSVVSLALLVFAPRWDGSVDWFERAMLNTMGYMRRGVAVPRQVKNLKGRNVGLGITKSGDRYTRAILLVTVDEIEK